MYEKVTFVNRMKNQIIAYVKTKTGEVVDREQYMGMGRDGIDIDVIGVVDAEGLRFLQEAIKKLADCPKTR